MRVTTNPIYEMGNAHFIVLKGENLMDIPSIKKKLFFF
jgi:hypothetical protein